VYSVRSLNDILNVIIPHFTKCPLITQKKADYLLFRYDYLLFRSAALFRNEKKHLSPEGLQHIVNTRASRNKGLTPSLMESFPNSLPLRRPNVSLMYLYCIFTKYGK
jgi:hypothetical protein